MFLDDAFRYCEADAGPFHIELGLHTLEDLEDALLVLLTDPNPIISNRDGPTRFLLLRHDSKNGSAATDELQSVVYQIPEYLPQLAFVSLNDRKIADVSAAPFGQDDLHKVPWYAGL